MFGWLAANIGTVVVLLILLAAVGLVIRKLVRDKRAGKTYCGCSESGTCSGHCAGCSGCTFPKDVKVRKPAK